MKGDNLNNYITNAFHGFVKSISMRQSSYRSFVIQDLLRILDLWFRFGDRPEIEPCIEQAKLLIPQEDWLLVVG